MGFTRADVREMVEGHVRQLYEAEREGRFYAVQNDVNDEIRDAAAHIAVHEGEAAVERFGRMYAEEQLALERDFRANPGKNAARLFGAKGAADKAPQAPKLRLIQRG